MLEADIRLLPAKQQTALIRRAIAEKLRVGHAKLESEIRAEYGGAGSVSVKFEVRVYAKRPKGFSKHPTKIMQLMLDNPRILREPNRLYVDRLQVNYPTYLVPANLMTRPIPPVELRKVRELAAKRGFTIGREIKTLSGIKLALRAGNAVVSSKRSYKVDVAFEDDTLTINGTSLSVSVHASGYRRVRLDVNGTRPWLRCDVLEHLLGKGGI